MRIEVGWDQRATGMLDLGSQQRGLACANLGQGLVVGAKRLLAAVPERGKHPWMSSRAGGRMRGRLETIHSPDPARSCRRDTVSRSVPRFGGIETNV